MECLLRSAELLMMRRRRLSESCWFRCGVEKRPFRMVTFSTPELAPNLGKGGMWDRDATGRGSFGVQPVPMLCHPWLNKQPAATRLVGCPGRPVRLGMAEPGEPMRLAFGTHTTHKTFSSSSSWRAIWSPLGWLHHHELHPWQGRCNSHLFHLRARHGDMIGWEAAER